MSIKTNRINRSCILMLALWQISAQAALSLRTLSAVASITVDSCTFERKKMNELIDKPGWRVEGYWAAHSDLARDWYGGKYSFPQKNDHAWTGKDEFVAKLALLEADLLENNDVTVNKYGITFIRYRGLSYSRIDGSCVGNAEFIDTTEKIKWPSGLRAHYFEEYNVVPSEEFYQYVMKRTIIKTQ